MQFNLDRRVKSVAVCSPLKGDGKTTVATNLATAVARTGKQVIVVDADMRHPQVHKRMAMSGKLGLADVLTGECSLQEALVEAKVKEGRLLVLPSGRPPANPSELIASEEMRALLVELCANSDLVIIDTPPTLQVSDAIPLFDRVSGVVVIGRLDKTTRQAMRRLVNVVETAGGSTLGVVATASDSSRLYGYGDYGGYRAKYGASYVSKWAEGNGRSPNGQRLAVRQRRRRRVRRR
jgi:capsular exopolysaccharide synthesis family protein